MNDAHQAEKEGGNSQRLDNDKARLRNVWLK
jgi:hypothetical protein